MIRWTALALCTALGAHAAQLELTRPELCTVSDAVVVGTITSDEVRWAAGAVGGVERIVWLEVEHTVAGASPRSVEITLPGGTIGDFSHWVEDVPQLKVNARYMLFLSDRDDLWRVIGGDQGAVRIATATGQPFETLPQALQTVEVCDAR